MADSKVAVIVVSYNTLEKLGRCLACIEPEFEVIVVDNASADGSAAMVEARFPNAELIRNQQNRGFGAANNQGLKTMRADYALLLNSDCYAEPGSIALLAAYLDAHPNVVAVGGQLLNPDGSLQESVARRLTLMAVLSEQLLLERLLPIYWITRRLDPKEPSEVPQVMGACLMMRPVEMFDERFFLYCEDTDLCLRLAKHGKIVYVPSAKFIHDLGSSSAGTGRWRSVARYNRGKELFFAIHHGFAAMAVCWLLNRVGALLRMLVWLVATTATLGTDDRYRSRVVLFWKVLVNPVTGPDALPRTRQ